MWKQEDLFLCITEMATNWVFGALGAVDQTALTPPLPSQLTEEAYQYGMGKGWGYGNQVNYRKNTRLLPCLSVVYQT